MPPFSLGSGVCSRCGCTDDEACEGGCTWADKEHTICSRCASPATSKSKPAVTFDLDEED